MLLFPKESKFRAEITCNKLRLVFFIVIHIISRPESGHIPVTYGKKIHIPCGIGCKPPHQAICGSIIIIFQIIAGNMPKLPSDTYIYRYV